MLFSGRTGGSVRSLVARRQGCAMSTGTAMLTAMTLRTRGYGSRSDSVARLSKRKLKTRHKKEC
ncbi:MAG: hypothetical protein J6N45_08385 [Alphaproteobacteria bacterium]|nr:hypothetical protein [Alphaproteobacteria bacterium]